MLRKSFYILVITVFFVWAVSIPAVFLLYPKLSDASSFGDMFGAVNALFSALAFAGVVYALILQDNETRLNAEQFQKSLKATEISAKLTAYSTLLQECDSALKRYERWEQNNPDADYRSVKETVRNKIKEHREAIEKLSREFE